MSTTNPFEGYAPSGANRRYDRTTYTTEGRKVDEVLADVDADPGLLAGALAAEQARGDKARVTLLDGLRSRQGERDTDQGDEPADDVPDDEDDDTEEQQP